MAEPAAFSTQRLSMNLRFIQGYRYLDRCGEALVRLENTLGEGWLPAEVVPTSGAIKNPSLGMEVIFNAQALVVRQAEWISFEHFIDQACRTYEVLWQVLDVKRINAPSLQVILQRGYQVDELEKASAYLRSLHLGTVGPEVLGLMEGNLDALDCTILTRREIMWNEQSVSSRRRMETSVVRQEKREAFDERIILRTRLLPERQREALAAYMKLRHQHPKLSPVAAQIDLEDSWESEFAAGEFDLHSFLEQTWAWAENIRKQLPRLAGGTSHG